MWSMVFGGLVVGVVIGYFIGAFCATITTTDQMRRDLVRLASVVQAFLAVTEAYHDDSRVASVRKAAQELFDKEASNV